MRLVGRFIVAAVLATSLPTSAQAQSTDGNGDPGQRVLQAGSQEVGGYRDFHLGASPKTIVELTETRTNDVRLIHERPAVMQELRWLPSSYEAARSASSKGNGVEQIVFSFYENQLSRIAVDYERSRTRGLTDRDMVDALSAPYGPPSSSTLASTGDAPTGNESVAARVVARWNGPGYAVVLSRWAYGAALRLVVESTRLAASASTDSARAIALDLEEGPQREAARAKRQQQDKDDAETAARSANKATFRP
jgi:hypothetical protein